MADPSAVSIVIPAMNEEDAIGDVVSQLRAAAPWREVLVVDDGSSDATGARAHEAPARASIRHPYNKGNGAAVKTGIRSATGEFVLIVDADGQHPPADARRLVAAARRVRSRRRRAHARRRRPPSAGAAAMRCSTGWPAT